MDLVQFPFVDQYDWDKRELIGQGGFANVYKVKNKKSGVEFAVKQLLMHKFDADFKMQALNTELKAMSECQDASIVKMYKSQKCKNYTYLIMELCQQNLKEYMQKKLMLSQKQAAEVISNIVESYKTLINKQYLHRDLKPKNILLKNGKFKLTDFGFAKKYSFNQQQLIEVCGTPLYMAPQLLYSKPYTDKCDVWSLGLILYQLLFGYPPFSTRYYQTYKKQVVNRDVSFPYNYQIGQNTKDLIQRCLQLEESDRIGWKQIFLHPFVKDKNPGKTIIYRQVNVNLQNILGRIQLSNYRDYTNAKKLFKSLEKQQQVGQKLFYQLLIELDSQITTYESNQIFQAADESHNGIINMNQFKKFYLQIDYRPAQDVASKRLQEIIRIAQAKNMKGLDIFKALDFNKSNKLEKAQFFIMVKKIAPMLEEREKQLIWKKMDQDNSGEVTWKQFLSSTIRDLTVNQKVHFKNYERAVRNVFCLRQFFQQRGVTSEQLFKVKKGSSNVMTLDQFAGMTKSINYAISRDEIVEMFRLIDSNNSESIEAAEIQKLLKGEISM